MRMLARRLLLPGLITLALTATGCSASPHTGAADPAAPATLAPAADGTQQLDVAAAPQGSPTPTAVARVGSGKGAAQKSSLKVASYDQATGRAVISSAPQKATLPGRSPAADKPVVVGDVIASAPAPGAPTASSRRSPRSARRPTAAPRSRRLRQRCLPSSTTTRPTARSPSTRPRSRSSP